MHNLRNMKADSARHISRCPSSIEGSNVLTLSSRMSRLNGFDVMVQNCFSWPKDSLLVLNIESDLQLKAESCLKAK